MTSQISRRAALIGGAALVGGALGAASLATGARRVAAAAPVQPIFRPRRVGATFDLFPFSPGTTYSQAVDIWNRTTGTTMHCWKVYFKESVFPSSIDDQIRTIINRGIEALISFKPVPPGNPPSAQAQAERQALRAALQMFQRAGLLAQVCLWQEVRPRDMTPAQYHQLVRYYGPTVRQFYPLVYNAAGYLGPTEWQAYDPGRDQLDGYAIDFYGGDFINKGFTLYQFAPLAGDLPIGIWEIGNTASASFMPTRTQLKAYMNHITSFLSNRVASGLPVGDVAWFNGPADASASGQNEIAGTNPNPLAPEDVVLYDRLYTAIDNIG
jgi:hypothetical protein